MSKEIESADAIQDTERIESLIWKHSGVKSVKDIAKLTGVNPTEVLRIRKELLEGVDDLTIQQKRQRLMVELEGMARDARARAEAIPDEFYAGTINAATGAIKAQLAELRLLEKQDSSRIDELNQKRVKELVELVQEVVTDSVMEIAEKYNLDQEELYTVFDTRMIEAARKRDMQ